MVAEGRRPGLEPMETCSPGRVGLMGTTGEGELGGGVPSLIMAQRKMEKYLRIEEKGYKVNLGFQKGKQF